MAISRELLEILACPKCKGEVRLNEGQDGLVCDACRSLSPHERSDLRERAVARLSAKRD